MKLSKCSIFFVSLISLAVTFGCGGNGGGDGGGSTTGTMSMSITDARPVLPGSPTNCFVTIDEVLVHQPGGAWKSIPMARNPFTIDLLHFSDGLTSEFVPPASLPAGRYTQLRLSVLSAKLVFEDTSEIQLEIPSENLKTDQNFEITVESGAAVDLTVDFDLSKSIVEAPAGTFKMKPVLHIVETTEAATINGTTNGQKAWVRVLTKDAGGIYSEEYTRKEIDAGISAFSIYWLVPDTDYRVEVDYNPSTDPLVGFQADFFKNVPSTDVEPGETATINLDQWQAI
jgi:hypothetical protein